MRNEKLIIAFFEAIRDDITNRNPNLKYAIKYQLRIEEIKVKITSKIGKKVGVFTLVWNDLMVQFSQGDNKSGNATNFMIKNDLSNFKEIRNNAGTD